jgi:ribosomal protein S12 methylthiotransferase
MPKVGMVSLGCPKNLVDSEVMLGILARHGYELTPRAEDAEVIIVNTCSFIDPAKRESIDTILEMAELKKSGSARRLVVAGCLVERYRQEILKNIPEVDYVIGTNALERVLDACAFESAGREAGGPIEPYLYHDFTPRVLSTPAYSAYLKIAEGCDHPCSFCVIPQMRGKFRSRRFESVIREAESLARQGAAEITLIGQDTTSYGEDLGLRDGLATLLRELGKIDDLVWVRFLYCYPNRLTDALISAVAETPKLARYFDIPLQHSSPDVLKLMRRGSSGGHFLKMLEKIRRAIPHVALRTSFIVGFPGESEDDFRALVDFVSAAEFDHLGVFLYSNEESSGSYGLPNQVQARTAKRRQRQLLALQRKISRRKLRGKIGERLPVLVEGRSEETDLLFSGRTQSQAPEIDGRVLINEFEGAEPVAGEFRWATIVDASDYDLIARLGAETFAKRAAASRTSVPPPRVVQIQPAAPAGV